MEPEILNLPEETILNICEQMDMVSLSNFIRSSKETKRICNEVLISRQVDKIIINSLSHPVRRTKLETSYPGREFIIAKNPSSFYLWEKVTGIDNTFILEDLGVKLTNPTESYSYIRRFIGNEREMEELLSILLQKGYLTGNFELEK